MPATLVAAPPKPSVALRGRRRPRAVFVAWSLIGVILVATALEVRRVFFGRNSHAVLAGRIYRSAQPSAADLKREIDEHGIRTVVNLRGCSFPLPWYLEESRATEALNLAEEDICFSAGRLPSPAELRRYVEVLDRAEYPLLLHCRRGADRTGMAAAIAVLLQTDQPFREARSQLGLRYGHAALGNPAALDRFFAFYADWLHVHGVDHSPAVFRRWLLDDYCPALCRCELEWLTHPHAVRAGKPFSVRVQARNSSSGVWRFRPGLNAGIHAGFILWDASDRQVANGKAALFDAEVPPGQSIAITVPLPALKEKGRYRLLVDMVDEQQSWFFQVGSEPLEEEFDVGE